ncbi:terpene synthase-like [Xylocopa sonorina]|uniref:terpene synthase-like n=1 Tax=Xylocopa sonorina TaxID=1818115 RepID=UPI00403B206B
MLQIQRSTVSDIICLARNVYNEEEEILMEPYNHYARLPGSEKMLTATLPKVLNYWFNIPQDKLNIIEDIAQLIGIGYLIIDDIQDNSTMRRGIPVAHIVYGIGSASNSALYAMSIAVKRVLQLNHPELKKENENNQILKEGLLTFIIYHQVSFCIPSRLSDIFQDSDDR